MAALLTGLVSDVTPHFVVRAAQPPTPDGKRFVLEPRDETSIFRDATLTFAAEGVLVGLDIVDHLDQITRIAFAAVERNPTLEPALFEFEIPAGFEVVGDLPSISD